MNEPKRQGRPILFDQKRRAGIVLPEELWNEAVEIAIREMRSANAQIVLWIQQGAERYREEDKNDRIAKL